MRSRRTSEFAREGCTPKPVAWPESLLVPPWRGHACVQRASFAANPTRTVPVDKARDAMACGYKAHQASCHPPVCHPPDAAVVAETLCSRRWRVPDLGTTWLTISPALRHVGNADPCARGKQVLVERRRSPIRSPFQSQRSPAREVLSEAATDYHIVVQPEQG
jgi:hypothetical protein